MNTAQQTLSEPPFQADDFDAWMAYQRSRLAVLVADAVRGQASTPEQEDTLNRLVADYEDLALAAGGFILPVYRALAGNVEPAMDLAVACGLNWAGSHCLDDLQDGDLTGHWATLSSAEVTFASIAVALVIPPGLLANLAAPVTVRQRLQASWRACVLDLASGQTEDLDRAAGCRRDDDDLDSIIASVGRREPFGWWMRMAAELADPQRHLPEAYHGFGYHFGIAKSAEKDFFQLLIDGNDSDLRNGTRTLHIAICEARMSADERGDFRKLRDAARTDLEAREAVTRRLRRERHVAALRDFLVDRLALASQCLAKAEPPEPLAGYLRRSKMEPMP